MIKTKYEKQEEELLSDDGIFAVKKSTYFDCCDKCCQCGFELLPGEDAVEIYATGDVIHKGCWNEYADENADIFGKSFKSCVQEDCY